MILIFQHCCSIPLGIPQSCPQFTWNIPEKFLTFIFFMQWLSNFFSSMLSSASWLKSICERGQCYWHKQKLVDKVYQSYIQYQIRRSTKTLFIIFQSLFSLHIDPICILWFIIKIGFKKSTFYIYLMVEDSTMFI